MGLLRTAELEFDEHFSLSEMEVHKKVSPGKTALTFENQALCER